MKNAKLVFCLLSVVACALCQSSIPGSMTVDGGVNPCALNANGTDSYQCSMPRALGSYQNGACYVTTIDVANTGPATLSIDGLTAKTIIRQDGSSLEDGDMKAGRTYSLCYGSASDNLQLIGVSAPSSGGLAANPGGSSGQLQYNNGGTFAGVSGTSVNGSRITHTGILDLSGPSARLVPPRGTTLPSTCEVGMEFFKTDEVPGQNWYDCTAINTWTKRSSGASGGGTGACTPGPGINIPPTGGASCSAATATAPWIWGGLDFPSPSASGETSIVLHTKTPWIWNGSSFVDPTGLRLRMSFLRVDGTSSGNVVITAKTRWVNEGDDLTNASWNTAATNDTTSGAHPVNNVYTTTIQALNMTGVAKGRRLEILITRSLSDTVPGTIRLIDFELGWNPTTSSGADLTYPPIPAVSIGGTSGAAVAGADGAQLYDDYLEWTSTNGTECKIAPGIHIPPGGTPACVIRSTTPPDASSAIQFPDSNTSVTINRRAPPNWNTVTPPSLLITYVQVGPGLGSVDFTASTWAIAQGSTYNSPSYVLASCDSSTAPGDGKVATAVCTALDTTGFGAGRGYKLKIARVSSDSLTVPVQIIDSVVRWTTTSACPAP